MKEPVELNDDVARALRMLGQAPPPEGMEARIAGRLRQRQAELSARPAGRRNTLWWGFAVAVAGVVAVVALVGHHRAGMTKMANRAAVELPQRAAPMVPSAIVQTAVPVHARRVRHSVRVVRAGTSASAPSVVPPPLPLSHQELLLLALARTPQLLPSLAGVTTSETVVDHGLGKNAIFELDHQDLTPLKSTLPGDTE